MSASNYFETALLELIFNGTPIANIANNASVSPLTDLYISLHIADPGEGGTQNSSEANYTGYARIKLARNAGEWSVTANIVVSAILVDFPQCTGGSSVVTHFGIGTDATGPGRLLFSGTLDSSLAVSKGITPSFASGDIEINLD